MLQASRFGTGWIASGRPPEQGDPATSTEAATGAEEAASAEAATGAEETASAEAAIGAEAATGAEEAGSAEATMDKPTGSRSGQRSVAQCVSRTRTRQRSRKSRETGKSWKSTGGWKRICSVIGHAAVVKRTPNTSPDKPCQQLGHMLARKCQRKRRGSASKPGWPAERRSWRPQQAWHRGDDQATTRVRLADPTAPAPTRPTQVCGSSESCTSRHPLTWIGHVARAKRTRCTTAGEPKWQKH
jgi:hypothetical protein